MIRLKARRAHALIVRPLPLPLGVERLALTLVIMVGGVGVNIAN